MDQTLSSAGSPPDLLPSVRPDKTFESLVSESRQLILSTPFEEAFEAAFDTSFGLFFSFLEKERGEGWWGSEKMAAYYAEQAKGDDPFNWIKAHPLMKLDEMEGHPFDHAGEGETSLLMALARANALVGRIWTPPFLDQTTACGPVAGSTTSPAIRSASLMPLTP